ncbi:MAG: Tex family protein [Bacillota bacterium]
MSHGLAAKLARELDLGEWQVRNTVDLLDQGNTIPFIARYRKEMTGEMDETTLRNLQERLTYLRNLEARRAEVIRLIVEQEKLTPELEAKLAAATTLQQIEDLYLPFRPKRRTRATVAREKGLEPLARRLADQGPEVTEPLAEAASFINPEAGVASPEEALEGASDIVAEELSDDAGVRGLARQMTWAAGILEVSAAQADQSSVYEQYYDFHQPAREIPAHRILAINRGEKEGLLKVRLTAPAGDIIKIIGQRRITSLSQPVRQFLEAAVEDSYHRLLAPSLERELRGRLTEHAEEQAINVFADNLRHLLLQAPVKGFTVMGIDPAYRTGCKVAVVDATGKLLETAVIYPTPPQKEVAKSRLILESLIDECDVDIIAIGNGTASRETELFVAELIHDVKRRVSYTIVSEAGASVYSASRLAAEEFPELDVSLRGAVSIARRLQDPLAELVKIDPRSIGVGQYQHDVDQKRLSTALAAVVESVVNTVGVDLNTASSALLSHIAGVNSRVAANIVSYREKHGAFRNRLELLNVPRVGETTFTQCAGFLRIPEGSEAFDNTPIHPESYEVAERLLSRFGYRRSHMGTPAMRKLARRAEDCGLEQLASELGTGVPTLRDILEALQRPGRDPRDDLPKPIFRTDVLTLEDLRPGMVLTGTVRNVVDFGAFVDIGVKQDGLVHISELSDRFVRRPMEVVSVGDIVKVKVLAVDLNKQRISLSMKGLTH